MVGMKTMMLAAAAGAAVLADGGNGHWGGRGGRGKKIKAVSGAGAGLFTPYEIAALETLVAAGLDLNKIAFSGSSGGAVMGALACSGGSVSLAIGKGAFMQSACAPTPGLETDIEPLLRAFYGAIIGDGWQNCNGKLEVTLTKAVGPLTGTPEAPCQVGTQSKVIDHWNTKEDLVDTLVATSFVVLPGLSTKCSVTYKGKQYQDGFLTDTLPQPDCLNEERYIGITPVPAALWAVPQLGVGEVASRADIYPGIRGLNTVVVPFELYGPAFFSSAVMCPFINDVVASGVADAQAWLAANPIPAANLGRRALRAETKA